MLKRFWSEECGADATEYGLLAALLGVAIIGGMQALGGSIDTMFNNLAGTISGS